MLLTKNILFYYILFNLIYIILKSDVLMQNRISHLICN